MTLIYYWRVKLNMTNLITFFGWMTIINLGIFLFSVLVIIFANPTITKLHSKIFSIDNTQLNKIYFHYLGLYKIFILVFCLVPYFALKIAF
jgi:hypothetical protein